MPYYKGLMEVCKDHSQNLSDLQDIEKNCHHHAKMLEKEKQKGYEVIDKFANELKLRLGGIPEYKGAARA